MFIPTKMGKRKRDARKFFDDPDFVFFPPQRHALITQANKNDDLYFALAKPLGVAEEFIEDTLLAIAKMKGNFTALSYGPKGFGKSRFNLGLIEHVLIPFHESEGFEDIERPLVSFSWHQLPVEGDCSIGGIQDGRSHESGHLDGAVAGPDVQVSPHVLYNDRPIGRS